MPLPLIYLVPGLMAAGAATWEWLKPERDPEWADKTVFNDRMRQIQGHITSLNAALGACPEFMAQTSNLAAWRIFKTNWQKFYGEVGTRTYFDPNQSQIANAKLYTSQLAKWIDKLKTFPTCQNVGVTQEALNPPTPSTDWLSTVNKALTYGAYGLGGYLLLKAFGKIK